VFVADNTKPNQVERFKEAARALECDEDEAAFDEKLKGIAKPKVRLDGVKPGLGKDNKL
jgi:hypothetical protein